MKAQKFLREQKIIPENKSDLIFKNSDNEVFSLSRVLDDYYKYRLNQQEENTHFMDPKGLWVGLGLSALFWIIIMYIFC